MTTRNLMKIGKKFNPPREIYAKFDLLMYDQVENRLYGSLRRRLFHGIRQVTYRVYDEIKKNEKANNS